MSTWAVVVVVVVIAIAVLWYFGTFNTFVRLRNLVSESWKQVDIELQRRHDLVPALVATVRQAADFERSTLESVIAARDTAVKVSKAQAPAVAEVSVAEDALTAQLNRLHAVAENYPKMHAIGNFANLQRQLTDTEDRIAASRRLYNGNVRALNTKIESMPASMIASVHRVSPAEYFEITTPTVGERPDVDQLFRGMDRDN